MISIILIAVSVFMTLRFYDRSYTRYTFAGLSLLIFTAQFILKAPWLSSFYRAYIFLLIPFFIVNGLLTGTGLENPVVWYNHVQIVNVRVLTIPIEDFFYGMDLVLMNVIVYSLLAARIYKWRKNRRRPFHPIALSTYSKANISA